MVKITGPRKKKRGRPKGIKFPAGYRIKTKKVDVKLINPKVKVGKRVIKISK